VQFHKQQSPTTTKRCFGSDIVIEGCNAFKVTAETVEFIEHGKQVKPRQRTDLLTEDKEYECEECFKRLCLMIGIRELCKKANVMFGLDLHLTDYALYIFKTTDLGRAYKAFVDMIANRIGAVTNALKSDDPKNFKPFLELFRDKPHLLYKPLYPKDKLSEMIEKLNSDEMQQIVTKIHPEYIILGRVSIGCEDRTIRNDGLKENDKLNRLLAYIVASKKRLLEPANTSEIVKAFDEYDLAKEKTYAEKIVVNIAISIASHRDSTSNNYRC
jgi:hypothetical protein